MRLARSLVSLPRVSRRAPLLRRSLHLPVLLADTATAVNPTLETFLKVVPPLAFQVVILSPLQAIRKFREEKTTGSVSPVPYAAMCANGAIWCTYGLMTNDPTIWAPNIPACLGGAFYSQQFFAHRAPDAPPTLPVFAGFGSIAGGCATAALVQTPEQAAMTIGYIGSAVCVVMFTGPLAAIRTVLAERSAASIPPAFSLASATNCALWVSYGYIVIGDAFIWVPNAAGFAASTAQLGLWLHFGSSPPAVAAAADAETAADGARAEAAGTSRSAGAGGDADLEKRRAQMIAAVVAHTRK